MKNNLSKIKKKIKYSKKKCFLILFIFKKFYKKRIALKAEI